MTDNPEDGNLVAYYEKMLPKFIDPEGFSHPPMLGLKHTGELVMAAPFVPQELMFDTAQRMLIANLEFKEVVFAVDRFTKPGQGTKYDDVLTVFWWYGPYEQNYGFRFGVINYKKTEPVIIEPIDWNNEFWNDILLKIVNEYCGRTVREVQKKLAEMGYSIH